MYLRALSARRTSRRCLANPPGPDPAPVSPRQLRALLAAVVRELLWGLPGAARELTAWRTQARTIPDPELREDALSSLATKRGHADGAALFAILPPKRSEPLLRLLVAYETIWDYLDTANERAASEGQANGRQLHLALIDALAPATRGSDYYLHHPTKDDGGYLDALVQVCRECCQELPGYEKVQGLVIHEAYRAQVLAINHETDSAQREASLKEWATHDDAGQSLVSWFELSGAASASLTIHALLALAVDESVRGSDIESARAAYSPWISAATTMLDSYVDQLEDEQNGDHSYVAHYATPWSAAERIQSLTRYGLGAARSLHRGEQHVVIVACMAAMYLSKDSARETRLRQTTLGITSATGSLTRLLLPVLRLWRIAYAQSSH